MRTRSVGLLAGAGLALLVTGFGAAQASAPAPRGGCDGLRGRPVTLLEVFTGDG